MKDSDLGESSVIGRREVGAPTLVRIIVVKSRQWLQIDQATQIGAEFLGDEFEKISRRSTKLSRSENLMQE